MHVVREASSVSQHTVCWNDGTLLEGIVSDLTAEGIHSESEGVTYRESEREAVTVSGEEYCVRLTSEGSISDLTLEDVVV